MEEEKTMRVDKRLGDGEEYDSAAETDDDDADNESIGSGGARVIVWETIYQGANSIG